MTFIWTTEWVKRTIQKSGEFTFQEIYVNRSDLSCLLIRLHSILLGMAAPESQCIFNLEFSFRLRFHRDNLHQEFSIVRNFWIPAFAGMTFLS
jgi:hypothetical protein